MILSIRGTFLSTVEAAKFKLSWYVEFDVADMFPAICQINN